MRAILTQIRAAVMRRRAQTATVLLISLLAGSVSTMALTLVVRSYQPWDDAFAQYSGPDLLFHFDASKVSIAQLEVTISLPGVTIAGPPHLTALVPFSAGGQKGPIQLIGRDTPGGRIDRLPIAAGRWPLHRGEIAVTRTPDSGISTHPHVGQTIRALTSNGTVNFKVVGEVLDIVGHGSAGDYSNPAPAAWLLPADLADFVDGGQVQASYEMAYRFANASTSDALAADGRQIEAALPADVETEAARDWMQMRSSSDWILAFLSTTIVSFTIFALLAVAVIVGSVVAGSVLSNYREIGVIKSLGFTPAQVVGIYAGQMVVPGLAGGLLGVPLGALTSRSFLDSAAQTEGLPDTAIFDPAVAVIVPAALALIVLLAAFVPAMRAAAIDPARAMAIGLSPRATRRSRISRVLAVLHTPRPLSLGAGDAFARPVRAALTLIAITIGIATATFAIGFHDLLVNGIESNHAGVGYAQDVVVNRYPGVSDQALASALSEQPDTDVAVGLKSMTMNVPGRQDPVVLYAMRGDAPALGYRASVGRWFRSPGEAVVGGTAARGTHVGDVITGTVTNGPPLTLTVVGLFDDWLAASANATTIRIDWDTLAAAMPTAAPDQYLIKLRSGSNTRRYARQIETLAPDFLDAHPTPISDIDYINTVVTGMLTGLAGILMLIAAAGVFNATLLSTRERVHDIAVFKTLGMTSKQIALMSLGAVCVLTTAAIGVGIPVGIWLERVILNSISADFGATLSRVGFAPLPIGLATLAAFALALAGASVPARWASATPVAEVLRSE